MRMGWIVAGIAAVMVAGGAAGAEQASPEYRPSFHPDQLKNRTGTANRVLVLGSPHLSQFAQDPSPVMLTPLLDRLAAWRPTVIATENVSGLQCDSLRRHPERYAETVATYCPDPALAQAATGLDAPAANAEAERVLAQWPPAPNPAQRRRLAAVFLAAGEPGSALVQWLRLTPAERRTGDGLTEELVAGLVLARMDRNETNLIAAALAARLGLERLWSVDDHSADFPDPPVVVEAASAAITRAWDNAATRERQAEGALLKQGLAKPEGLLAYYRALNAPEQPALVYQSDFGAALTEPSPQGFGRGYVGYWETRNLRMVANIRDVLAREPGARLLAIVGASHKGYYEAYLNQMHDVELADASAVLR